MEIVLAALLMFQTSSTAAPAADAAESAAPVQGPSEPRSLRTKVASAVPDPCRRGVVEPGVILVCGKRDDYRIDPDVLKAQRLLHNQVKPKPPERFVDTSCQVVGVMGCINKPTVNVLQAISTGAAMAKALVNGDNVGKLFITDRELSEYELYQQAKRDREEKELGSADLSGQ
nr:hypothetical protein [uncultured Sphingomonas sp.]